MASSQEIKVPDIGGASGVEVIEILVKEGDSIAIDTPLVTLESDKASMEIPSPAEGIVKSIAVKIGDKISEGDVFLTLEAAEGGQSAEEKKPASEKADSQSKEGLAAETTESDQKDSGSSEKTESEQKRAGASEKAEAEQRETSVATEAMGSKPQSEKIDTSQELQRTASPDVSSSAAVFASPGVRRLAREFGVDLSKVSGSGRKGRISKEDVQAFVKNKLQQSSATTGGFSLPAAPEIDFTKFGEIESKPLNKIKRLTGENVHRSWVTIPHVTQFDEADITDLEAFRKLEVQNSKSDVKLTILAFVCKVVAKALATFPQFNASLDAAGTTLIYKKYFNIGIAVETPNGLVVPVIKGVDRLSVSDIAKEMARLSIKAREKGLMPVDMSGGCFTISSLGGIGGTAFTPIVNSPEVAILGLSRSAMKPVYMNNQFVPRLMLPLSLSYDHRVIDGAEAARFTRYLSESLSDIRRILL